MPRHCLTLDLQDTAHAVSEYKRYHEAVWPAVKASLSAAGVNDMEIYLLGTRMFMIMEVSDDFTFERKAAMDLANPSVQEWEKTMGTFFKALPDAKPGQMWTTMEKVFSLADQQK